MSDRISVVRKWLSEVEKLGAQTVWIEEGGLSLLVDNGHQYELGGDPSVCPECENGHVPDWNTVKVSAAATLDVNCFACGRSGCIMTLKCTSRLVLSDGSPLRGLAEAPAGCFVTIDVAGQIAQFSSAVKETGSGSRGRRHGDCLVRAGSMRSASRASCSQCGTAAGGTGSVTYRATGIWRMTDMAKMKLLGVQEEVVQGLVISVEPPAQLCELLSSNGEIIAKGTMQVKKAEGWARRKCSEIQKRVGPEESKRLGYDQPMELRVYGRVGGRDL